MTSATGGKLLTKTQTRMGGDDVKTKEEIEVTQLCAQKC